ncbi:MAG: hypothetical protein H7Z41_01675 [Cytophagales bacterium]|nr:hypothetical protein [Armatimonadota bacterium]
MQTEFIDTEIAQRAKTVYERHIQHEIKPDDVGKYLVIDLETGEYEMDSDDVAASMRAYEKKPVAERYCIRIGHRTTGAFRSLRLPQG